jgi:selenide,water dikinase
VTWMRMLNRDAAGVLRRFEPSAVTDVTGFGLLGHAHEMASRSGVRIRLDAERLPALDGALESARAGVTTAGTRANREYAQVEIDGRVPPALVELAYDPQTAGGLLVALPREKAPALQAEFDAAGLFLARIGLLEAGEGVVLT